MVSYIYSSDSIERIRTRTRTKTRIRTRIRIRLRIVVRIRTIITIRIKTRHQIPRRGICRQREQGKN
jgi:hypothetical protein